MNFTEFPRVRAPVNTPRIFKTNHAANLTRDAALRLVDVGLATCAAPTYFEVAALHNPLDGTTELLSDGGLYANNPALIGLVEALTYLDTPPERVQLLSVSTPRADLRISPTKLRASGGLINWLFLLPEIFVETPSMLTDRAVKELAQRLKVTYERVKLKQPPIRLAIDTADQHATDELLSIGASEAGSNDVRKRLTCFFERRTCDGGTTRLL